MSRSLFPPVGLSRALTLLLALVGFGLLGSCAQIPQASPTPTVAFWGDESHTIQLFWFYKPPGNGDLATLAQRFRLIILTQHDEEALRQLRLLGYHRSVPQYFRFDAIKDPGDCTSDPPGNQVAYRPGDFCWIATNHPDWFLLDREGNRIYDGGKGQGYVFMDPGNPEWRRFVLQRISESQAQLGFDGVLLDNVDASLARYEQKGRALLRYPDDAAFQAAVEDFLRYLYENYFHPQNRLLLANIVANRDFEVWYRYLRYLDGAMDESWAVGWNQAYRSVDAWEDHLIRAERIQALGKWALLVSSGPRDDLLRQRFAFASYLLITNGRAYFRYAHADAYREIWLYPDYEWDLGLPLGPRYRQGDRWRRDFARGSLVVDPRTHEVELLSP